MSNKNVLACDTWCRSDTDLGRGIERTKLILRGFCSAKPRLCQPWWSTPLCEDMPLDSHRLPSIAERRGQGPYPLERQRRVLLDPPEEVADLVEEGVGVQTFFEGALQHQDGRQRLAVHSQREKLLARLHDHVARFRVPARLPEHHGELQRSQRRLVTEALLLETLPHLPKDRLRLVELAQSDRDATLQGADFEELDLPGGRQVARAMQEEQVSGLPEPALLDPPEAPPPGTGGLASEGPGGAMGFEGFSSPADPNAPLINPGTLFRPSQ